MDLANDELDYEEDEVDNDYSKEDSAEKSPKGKTSDNQTFSGSDELYLQLDCPEEEDFGFDELSKESVAADAESNIKGDEEKEKPLEENSLGKVQDVTKNTQKNDLVRNNECSKKKNKIRRNNHRPDKIKKWGSSPWLPGFKIPLISDPNVKYNNQTQPVPLLALNVARPEQPVQAFSRFHTQTFNSLPTINGVNDCRFSQLTYKPVFNHIRRSLSKDRSKSRGSKIFKHKKIFKNENNYNSSTQEQKMNCGISNTNCLNGNYQNGEINHWKYSEQNGNNIGLEQTFQFSPLKDDEKKLVTQKKKARLKRFMQDDMLRREEKSSASSIDKGSQKELDLGLEYFKKMELQRMTREKLLSLKGRLRKNSECVNESDALLTKPDINKEWLLLKRNPFDANSETSNRLYETAIKQENDGIKIKTEISDSDWLSLTKNKNEDQIVKKENKERPMCFNSAPLEFGALNTSSPVKFVRTISKSFSELGFRIPPTEFVSNENGSETATPHSNVTSPFITNKKNFQTNDFPTQIESQLNGCIVKVLNIPPSTTTNDVLALCSPVGIVKEVKLNFPKENSVVIRFAEPSCADNFFNLYHGQKMNDYFLNVIVV